MKIADSARHQLETLVAQGSPGSMPSLLVGYTYDESWNKTPQVEIALMSAEQVQAMRRDLAGTGKQLLHELDGVTFVLPLSYNSTLLEGWLLVHTEGDFTLVQPVH